MLSWRHSGFHVYIGDRIIPSRRVLATWPGTLSVPAFHRNEWSSFCPLGYVSAEESVDGVAKVVSNGLSSKESKQNWARLIQKIYEVDPLVCPKCQGQMRVISFIDGLDVIEKILRHLDLWDVRNHDPPQKVSDYILELVCDETDSRIPVFDE